MSWIDKILPSGVRSEGGEKRSSVPEGLWKKCVKCQAVLYRPDVERNDDVFCVPGHVSAGTDTALICSPDNALGHTGHACTS